MGNVFGMTGERRPIVGYQELADQLGRGHRLAEDSEVLNEALGNHIHTSFIQNKKIEWEDYRSTVTDYEVSGTCRFSDKRLCYRKGPT